MSTSKDQKWELQKVKKKRRHQRNEWSGCPDL